MHHLLLAALYLFHAPRHPKISPLSLHDALPIWKLVTFLFFAAYQSLRHLPPVDVLRNASAPEECFSVDRISIRCPAPARLPGVVRSLEDGFHRRSVRVERRSSFHHRDAGFATWLPAPLLPTEG